MHVYTLHILYVHSQLALERRFDLCGPTYTRSFSGQTPVQFLICSLESMDTEGPLYTLSYTRVYRGLECPHILTLSARSWNQSPGDTEIHLKFLVNQKFLVKQKLYTDHQLYRGQYPISHIVQGSTVNIFGKIIK